MKFLIIGQGGREHALAWKIAQEKNVSEVWVAPGNAGTALEDKVNNVDIAATDIEKLLKFAIKKNIDFTVVGPEAALVAGITDVFKDMGLSIFAPSKQAAQLESSKSFAKDFFKRHNIPTAKYASFTKIKPALDYLEQLGAPWVIKADGLSAGKGVVIAYTKDEAIDAITTMLISNTNNKIVIEEYLTGEEASFIVMVDANQNILPLATSQDHKARDNNDKGPNTGGMGAYSPAPIIDSLTHKKIMEEIIKPTVTGLQQEGIDYTGFLYAGLMIDLAGKPKILEYNCRLGDPEAEAILMRLDYSLVKLIIQALSGNLNQENIDWSTQAAVGVFLVSSGYPGSYDTGKQITGIDKINTAKVFHAGSKLEDNKLITTGGRVLCVTAKGDSIEQAKQLAYNSARQIKWDGVYYRTDIADKALK